MRFAISPPTWAGPYGTSNNQSGVPHYIDRVHGNTFYIPELVNNAAGKHGLNGHSYEIAGFFAGNRPVDVKRKTQSTVVGYVYKVPLGIFPEYSYITGSKASPSNVWIVYDADDRDAGDPDRQTEDFPDKGDNHGTAGGNVMFADGHAEWVPRKKYFESFLLGTDEGRSTRPPN